MGLEIIILWLVFVALIGVWANAIGRNAVLWSIVSIILSPIITAVILLILGKTLEKKAEEAKMMKELMKD